MSFAVASRGTLDVETRLLLSNRLNVSPDGLMTMEIAGENEEKNNEQPCYNLVYVNVCCGEISSGATDDLDVDKDFSKIARVKEDLD